MGADVPIHASQFFDLLPIVAHAVTQLAVCAIARYSTSHSLRGGSWRVFVMQLGA
jgi:hypothetical protein